jgi:hypothetical protein
MGKVDEMERYEEQNREAVMENSRLPFPRGGDTKEKVQD